MTSRYLPRVFRAAVARAHMPPTRRSPENAIRTDFTEFSRHTLVHYPMYVNYYDRLSYCAPECREITRLAIHTGYGDRERERYREGKKNPKPLRVVNAEKKRITNATCVRLCVLYIYTPTVVVRRTWSLTSLNDTYTRCFFFFIPLDPHKI